MILLTSALRVPVGRSRSTGETASHLQRVCTGGAPPRGFCIERLQGRSRPSLSGRRVPGFSCCCLWRHLCM